MLSDLPASLDVLILELTSQTWLIFTVHLLAEEHDFFISVFGRLNAASMIRGRVHEARVVAYLMDLSYNALTVSVVSSSNGSRILRGYVLTDTINLSCTHWHMRLILLVRVVDNHIIGCNDIIMRDIFSGLVKRAFPATNILHNFSTGGLETNRTVAFALLRLVYLLRRGVYLLSIMGISTILSILSN